MQILTALAGLTLLVVVLWDAFETVVLPRRVTRRVRLTRFFYRCTWRPWSAAARLLPEGRRRENYLSFYGPLSLILLLTVWAAGLVAAFGFLDWAVSPAPPGQLAGFGSSFYLSGSSFFTLGLGDVTPRTPLAKAIAVVEAGMGFGFLAIVIGYLPVIYQAFSRREVSISLLDARAGSPPTAAELLRRHTHDHGMEALQRLFEQWEHWSAELLESHLSYPVLAYFRSQHNNQSWVGALAAVLDSSALVTAGVEGACERQAELAFAMARHAVVDLAQVFSATPSEPAQDRLPPGELARLRARLTGAGLRLREGTSFDRKLARLRRMYEPYLHALSEHLALKLPPWMIESRAADNWETSAWEKRPVALESEPAESAEEEHF